MSIFDRITDGYERKARTFPGLLAVLPLIVPIFLLFGAKSPVVTGLLGLISTCGVVYLLGSIARGLGKRLEEKLVINWGGLPTTLILRHRDTYLDKHTKARFHLEILAKTGMALPTAGEEETDPKAADEAYIGATRLLRELLRGKAQGLLLKENIAYGYHRNMAAMKPIGLATSAIGVGIGFVMIGVIGPYPDLIDMKEIPSHGIFGGIIIAISIFMGGCWLYFGAGSVKKMGYAYAERLFEGMKSLASKRKKIG